MTFADCSLVNACLSETAKSAPEVRTVCLQLPLKHMNMVLVISKNHRNGQHKILNKHRHPISIHIHWSHVISLILYQNHRRFWQCAPAEECIFCIQIPASEKNIHGGGGKQKTLQMSRMTIVQPDCYCSIGKCVLYLLFFFLVHVLL